MSNKRKIINDPVFGFINIPNRFIYDLIQHPYFQRLHRIKQLGLSSFVYPGAQHTRMQHSLGALHLTSEAIKELRAKGHAITDEEADGVMAAILLHDIGHGPYSHVLEYTLIKGMPHEEISLMLMQEINDEFGGALDLTIRIFTDNYHKRFLHQLISSQLDMDRLDYLRRDSFFTGVVEGTIGSARIIKMLDVSGDRLMVESKGIYSIENFLVARRFMYWQVYLHKTSLAAEKMLINILLRAKELAARGEVLFATPALDFFISNDVEAADFSVGSEALRQYVALDDSDVLSAVKVWASHPDRVLATLCSHFINRQLFKTRLEERPINEEERDELLTKYATHFGVSREEAAYFFAEKSVSSLTYSKEEEQIMILYSDGEAKSILQVSDMLNSDVLNHESSKHYLCFYLIK